MFLLSIFCKLSYQWKLIIIISKVEVAQINGIILGELVHFHLNKQFQNMVCCSKKNEVFLIWHQKSIHSTLLRFANLGAHLHFSKFFGRTICYFTPQLRHPCLSWRILICIVLHMAAKANRCDAIVVWSLSQFCQKTFPM